MPRPCNGIRLSVDGDISTAYAEGDTAPTAKRLMGGRAHGGALQNPARPCRSRHAVRQRSNAESLSQNLPERGAATRGGGHACSIAQRCRARSCKSATPLSIRVCFQSGRPGDCGAPFASRYLMEHPGFSDKDWNLPNVPE